MAYISEGRKVIPNFMTDENQHIDKELDLKEVWKMTPKQKEAWLEEVKKRRKKLAKGWRPQGH